MGGIPGRIPGGICGTGIPGGGRPTPGGAGILPVSPGCNNEVPGGGIPPNPPGIGLGGCCITCGCIICPCGPAAPAIGAPNPTSQQKKSTVDNFHFPKGKKKNIEEQTRMFSGGRRMRRTKRKKTLGSTDSSEFKNVCFLFLFSFIQKKKKTNAISNHKKQERKIWDKKKKKIW
ncbi:hypothetical protein RFI_22033 [Reticulomyxa filosa]|uniref:Uncharacterized protein n=1 Tax=Reticulomyxa filosa TaxID=46433 RepID=X6MQG6_RETFI|nr:hypothetical protein RFI_22033 [Reticulomyxa filosa]|eukprot:ETO15330.1 hypothetical protein RFI_22033 [Reticulomyxa filosa]